QLAAFHVIDLPANDLAAKNIHEQVQVKETALDRGRQVRDVPAVQGIGCLSAQGTRLVTFLGRSLGTTVPELVLCLEYTIKRRFRGNVLSAVGQPGDDLA